jgi:hypothetical protein
MKHKTQPTHATQQPTETSRRNAGSLPASGDEHSTSADAHTGDQTQAGSLRSDAGDTAEPTLADLQAENAALKKQLQEQTAHAGLKDKLKQAGARTPKLLLDAAKEALKFTAAGEIENAVEIIEALREKFPEQFGITNHALPTAPAVHSIDAGAGRLAKPQLTRDALAKMTPAQIAELNWDDVRRVLAAK